MADLGDKLHVLSGTNTDSGRATVPAAFEGIADFKVEKETLFDVLTECRVVSRTPCLQCSPCLIPLRVALLGALVAGSQSSLTKRFASIVRLRGIEKGQSVGSMQCVHSRAIDGSAAVYQGQTRLCRLCTAALMKIVQPCIAEPDARAPASAVEAARGAGGDPVLQRDRQLGARRADAVRQAGHDGVPGAPVKGRELFACASVLLQSLQPALVASAVCSFG